MEFLYKKNEIMGDKGYTLIEILLVIAITSIISSILIIYGRTGEKQIALFREQAKILGIITKTKALALATFNKQDVPCGYGIHFDIQNHLYFIFREEKGDSGACDSTDGEYTDDNDKIFESVVHLPPNVIQFDGSLMTVQDIIFYPPDPRIKIYPADLDPANIILKIKDSDVNVKIYVTKSGQINSFQ